MLPDFANQWNWYLIAFIWGVCGNNIFRALWLDPRRRSRAGCYYVVAADGAHDRLAKIVLRTDCKDSNEVLTEAVALYDVITEEQTIGGELHMHYPDGTTKTFAGID